MSDSEVILKVEGLCKTYFSEQRSKQSVKDLVSRPFQKYGGDSSRIDALKDVSFELKKGESLGIIGSNGAGKSTLLKILSGVTTPTSGKVTINGRVLSVLDIGTGFHPDLTGKENVYLNGEILGMSRAEIDLKYSEIVDFSGIGAFIHRPVKQYSSGMYLRLAFSIVINMDADLLLFDEVLAVGDASFHQKCQRHIRSLPEKGKSVILVSHSMTDTLNYCNRVIHLERGKVKEEGTSHSVVSHYTEEVIVSGLESNSDSEKIRASTLDDYLFQSSEKTADQTITSAHRIFNWNVEGDKPFNEYVRLHSLQLLSVNKGVTDDIHPTDSILLEAELEPLPNTKPSSLAFQLMDSNGTRLFNSISSSFSHNPDESVFKIQAVIPPNLFNTGIYQLVVATFNDEREIIYFSGFHEFYFKINYPAQTPKDTYVSIGPMKPVIDWNLSAKS